MSETSAAEITSPPQASPAPDPAGEPTGLPGEETTDPGDDSVADPGDAPATIEDLIPEDGPKTLLGDQPSTPSLVPTPGHGGTDSGPPAQLFEPAKNADGCLPVRISLPDYAKPSVGLQGAALQLKGTRNGVDVVVDAYATNNKDFEPVCLDAGTDAKFIVNYLVNYSSGNANAAGKVTGSYQVGADTATATNITNKAVPVTVAADGDGARLTPAVRMSTDAGGKTDVDFLATAGSSGPRISPVPGAADVVLRDVDGSMLPIRWWTRQGVNYAPVRPTTALPSYDMRYSVAAPGYTTATGVLTINKASPTYAVTPDATAAQTTTISSGQVSVALTPSDRALTHVQFGVETPDTVAAKITVAGPQGEIAPAAPGTYRVPQIYAVDAAFAIPADQFGSSFTYRVTAPGMHTFEGSFDVDAAGLVTDTVDHDPATDSIGYYFDRPNQIFRIALRPARDAAIDEPGKATAAFDDQIEYLFANVGLETGVAEVGPLEVTNTSTYDMKIVDVEVDGNLSMAHPVLRTLSPPVMAVLGKQPVTFTQVRDIVALASEKFGVEFKDYYDYLLYYFENNLGKNNTSTWKHEVQHPYTNLTDLRQLHPLDAAVIFKLNNNFTTNDPRASVRFDLDPFTKDFGGVDVIGDPGLAFEMIEPDPKVAQFGYDFLYEKGLYFTLDVTKAADGELPTNHDEVTSGKWDGLQYMDLVKHTPAAKQQIDAMVDGIVIPAGGSHVFENAALSTIGSYLWNGYTDNRIGFDFEIKLTFEPVGIDGYIFEDVDRSGSLTEGDTPMSGIEVNLYDAESTGSLMTVTTDEDGYYVMPHGTDDGEYEYASGVDYHTRFTVPEGYALTQPAGTGRDDSRFALAGDVAKSHPVQLSYDESTRLNGGLVSAEDPTPPPIDPPTDEPTTGPTSPTDRQPSASTSVLAGPGGDDPRLPWTGAVVGPLLALAALAIAAGAVAIRRSRATRQE